MYNGERDTFTMTRPSISLRRAIETYHRDTSPNGQRLFWKKIVTLFESAFSRWLRFNPEMTQRYEREEARNEWALSITERSSLCNRSAA